MSSPKRHVLGMVVAASALVASLGACSSSGNAATSNGPIKIALLASTTQQDTWAQAGWMNGAELAVKDLNAKGGVLGRKVELSQFRTPLDPNQTKSNLLAAAQTHPAAIIGLPVLTADSLATTVGTLGVPFIYLNGEPEVYRTAKFGSQWGFFIRPDNGDQMAAGLSQYLSTHTVKTAGLLCLANGTGKQWCDAATQVLKAKNVRIISTQQVNITDTDMTNPALAMKGADLVVTALAQAQIPTVAKAMSNNGLTPHMLAAASIAPLPSGAMPSSLYPNLSGVTDCLPAGESAPAAKTFVAEYKAAYAGATPDIFGAEVYDSVMMVAHAIESVKSTDPTKVADAIRGGSGYQGVCATYKSDKNQILNHQSVAVSYNAAGTLQLGQQVTVG